MHYPTLSDQFSMCRFLQLANPIMNAFISSVDTSCEPEYSSQSRKASVPPPNPVLQPDASDIPPHILFDVLPGSGAQIQMPTSTL